MLLHSVAQCVKRPMFFARAFLARDQGGRGMPDGPTFGGCPSVRPSGAVRVSDLPRGRVVRRSDLPQGSGCPKVGQAGGLSECRTFPGVGQARGKSGGPGVGQAGGRASRGSGKPGESREGRCFLGEWKLNMGGKGFLVACTRCRGQKKKGAGAPGPKIRRRAQLFFFSSESQK